jgi:hypothetical protein
MELLIIDEVERRLLEGDYMMQTVRKTTFGGVQALFIGDLLQLLQLDWEEWRTLSILQGNSFSSVVQQNPPFILNYQNFPSDRSTFISVLNNLRNNQISIGH